MNHTIAVTELLAMGCRASILPFVTSFLSGRQHRVRYADAISEYADISCGVPQGTKVGSIIFLCLVNSICLHIEERAKFVDDLSLARIISIINEMRFEPLQENLNLLSTECRDKDMEPNPIKCEALYSIPPKRPLVLPDLHLNGTPLPVVDECKLLGVYLNTSLNWNTHVDRIVKKASNSVFILLKAKKFQVAMSTLVTLYLWYVRTPLEYAAPVWHPGLSE